MSTPFPRYTHCLRLFLYLEEATAIDNVGLRDALPANLKQFGTC